MATADLEPRLTRILVERLGLSREDIRPEARLSEDLGLDSLDAVELAIAAEREFDVGIVEEQVAGVKTVADILALIDRLQVEKPRS